MQRPRAALNPMSNAKFITVRSSRYQRARNRAHYRLAAKRVIENGQRMKAIAHQAIAQRAARREIPPPDGTKARDWFPLHSLARLQAEVDANDLIATTPVENAAIPREDSNAAPGTDSTKV